MGNIDNVDFDSHNFKTDLKISVWVNEKNKHH